MAYGAALNRLIKIAIDLRDPAFKPVDAIRQAPTDRPGGVLQTMSLRRQHVQQLPAAHHQCVQLLQNRFLEGGMGRTRSAKERQEVRIQAIGLGQLPRRPREVADLPRIRKGA